MSDTPDPMKDFEPTEPYAPTWVEGPVEFVCAHPGLTATLVVCVALLVAVLA